MRSHILFLNSLLCLFQASKVRQNNQKVFFLKFENHVKRENPSKLKVNLYNIVKMAKL